jgi:hypothetical protein
MSAPLLRPSERFSSLFRPSVLIVIACTAASDIAISQVERALRLRATGELVIPRGPPGYFSIDNWGDQHVRSPAGKVKTIRRATKFLATIQKKWGKDHWEKLCEVASEWTESRKRAASSHASSDAGDLPEEDEDDEEMIILSD